MHNIIVHEFNVEVEGKWNVVVHDRGSSIWIPMFGFNSEGKVIPHKTGEQEGYAVPQKEWIDQQIIEATKHIRNGYESLKKDHPWHVEELQVDPLPIDEPIYVALIRSSNYPNQIGIAANTVPMSLDNMSIRVKKSEYKI